MIYRNVREALRAVDPDLKIIPGGVRRSKRKPNKNEWEDAGGLFCTRCGQETVRIFNGVCFICYREDIARSEQKQADRAEKQYYQKKLSEGTISLAQMREGRL